MDCRLRGIWGSRLCSCGTGEMRLFTQSGLRGHASALPLGRFRLFHAAPKPNDEGARHPEVFPGRRFPPRHLSVLPSNLRGAPQAGRHWESGVFCCRKCRIAEQQYRYAMLTIRPDYGSPSLLCSDPWRTAGWLRFFPEARASPGAESACVPPSFTSASRVRFGS